LHSQAPKSANKKKRNSRVDKKPIALSEWESELNSGTEKKE